jgi:hypothetical protein
VWARAAWAALTVGRSSPAQWLALLLVVMAIASETGNEASAASGEMCAAIDHAVSISKYVAIRGDDINHRRYVSGNEFFPRGDFLERRYPFWGHRGQGLGLSNNVARRIARFQTESKFIWANGSQPLSLLIDKFGYIRSRNPCGYGDDTNPISARFAGIDDINRYRGLVRESSNREISQANRSGFLNLSIIQLPLHNSLLTQENTNSRESDCGRNSGDAVEPPPYSNLPLPKAPLFGAMLLIFGFLLARKGMEISLALFALSWCIEVVGALIVIVWILPYIADVEEILFLHQDTKQYRLNDANYCESSKSNNVFGMCWGVA